jgi:hypothetical protein
MTRIVEENQQRLTGKDGEDRPVSGVLVSLGLRV